RAQHHLDVRAADVDREDLARFCGPLRRPGVSHLLRCHGRITLPQAIVHPKDIGRPRMNWLVLSVAQMRLTAEPVGPTLRPTGSAAARLRVAQNQGCWRAKREASDSPYRDRLLWVSRPARNQCQ